MWSLGDYQKKEKIGMGSFGKIYRGVDRESQEVAIKVEEDSVPVSLLAYEYQMLQYLWDQTTDKSKAIRVHGYTDHP